MKRKKSLRDAARDKFYAAGGFATLKPRERLDRRGTPAKPRSTLKKASKARQREQRAYHEERQIWLALPQNRPCAICLCLGASPRPATEVHHSRGRIGRLLRDQRFWVPSCRDCREIPHNRPAWAREMGLLSSATDWNTYPR